MKKVTKTIAFVLIGVALSTGAFAQKIAHIQLDSLVTLMPETKKAQDIAQEFYKQFEKEIVSMQTELQTKYTEYQNNVNTYSELVRKSKEDELNGIQQRLEAFREQSNQETQKKNADLYKIIIDKARKAIDAVAKEGGYKYVLDTSTGVVLFSEPGDDIMPLVKKKLDSMPEAVLPGAPAANGGGATTPKGPSTPPKGATTPKAGGK